MTENEIAKIVVDACFRIHSKLGPGLFESVYEEILTFELIKNGLDVKRQVPIPLVYEQIKLEAGFRADMVINNILVLELKSVEQISSVHKKQLLTYLKLMDKRLGLLINFNVDLIKNGITRIVNNL